MLNQQTRDNEIENTAAANAAESATTEIALAEDPAAAAIETRATGSGDSPDRFLAKLMRKALDGRRRMTEAQTKLRDLERESRGLATDKRSRFEKLRAAALAEYRNARAEAAQARRQLISNLKPLATR